MSDVSGIPNMGFGGGGYFGGSAALGYPAMSASQINASMGYNPNAAQYNPWANTPGGFGAQTAAYQQAAANSYGNINSSSLYGGGGGGSYGYGGGNDTMGSGGWTDPFTQGAAPQAAPGGSTAPAPATDFWSSYFNSLTGGQQQANPYTGASAGYNPYDNASYGLGTSWQPPAQTNSWASLGYNPSAAFGGGFQNAPSQAFDPYFYSPGVQQALQQPGTYYDTGMGNPSTMWSGNYWGATPGGGIGNSASPPGGYGYGDTRADMSSILAARGGGDYWGANASASTPSQYYTGNRYFGGDYGAGSMPGNYKGLYGADNEGGALPLGGYVNPYGNAFNQ